MNFKAFHAFPNYFKACKTKTKKKKRNEYFIMVNSDVRIEQCMQGYDTPNDHASYDNV